MLTQWRVCIATSILADSSTDVLCRINITLRCTCKLFIERFLDDVMMDTFKRLAGEKSDEGSSIRQDETSQQRFGVVPS